MRDKILHGLMTFGWAYLPERLRGKSGNHCEIVLRSKHEKYQGWGVSGFYLRVDGL